MSQDGQVKLIERCIKTMLRIRLFEEDESEICSSFVANAALKAVIYHTLSGNDQHEGAQMFKKEFVRLSNMRPLNAELIEQAAQRLSKKSSFRSLLQLDDSSLYKKDMRAMRSLPLVQFMNQLPLRK
jgi:hypothetical protein